MKNWVVVVLEGEHAAFHGEIAFVKGPFETYEAATAWAETDKSCADGQYHISTIEAP